MGACEERDDDERGDKTRERDRRDYDQGDDEAISNAVPVYPSRHEITTAIPTEQCATCHFQGGRIGLLYRGIREGGFGEVPENAEIWAESAYGHTAGYYILDEDTTNDVDETPPDLHYAAGLEFRLPRRDRCARRWTNLQHREAPGGHPL